MKNFKQYYLELERRAEAGELTWRQAMAAAVTLALVVEPRARPAPGVVRGALALAGVCCADDDANTPG